MNNYYKLILIPDKWKFDIKLGNLFFITETDKETYFIYGFRFDVMDLNKKYIFSITKKELEEYFILLREYNLNQILNEI